MKSIYKFFLFKWYFDIIYNNYINIILIKNTRLILFEIGDKGLFEIFGPFGCENILVSMSYLLRKFFTSDASLYGYFMVSILILIF